MVFGLDHVRGVRWPEVLGARGELDPALLIADLPRERDVVVMSHGRDRPVVVPAEADAAVLDALANGTDVVLIDAGRPTPVTVSSGAGGSAGAAPSDVRFPTVAGADDVILLVDATPQSLAAATVIAEAIPEAPTWWLAQRSTRASAHLPETVQAALDLPLAAVVGHDPRCATSLLDGVVPGRRGPLAKAAAQIVQTLTQPVRRAA